LNAVCYLVDTASGQPSIVLLVIAVALRFGNSKINQPTNQPPFYSHYTGQPALAGTSS